MVSASASRPARKLEGRRRHQVAGPQQLVGDVLGVQPRHGDGEFTAAGAVRALLTSVQHPFLPSSGACASPGAGLREEPRAPQSGTRMRTADYSTGF